MSIFALYSSNGDLLSATVNEMFSDGNVHSVENPYVPSDVQSIKYMAWTKNNLSPIGKSLEYKAD